MEYVTEYEAALHLAYKVTFDVVVKLAAFSATDVPNPSADVFQPAKVNPVFTNVPEFDATV